MASCKRSTGHVSGTGDDEDPNDEDPATKEEFEVFKRWLDKAASETATTSAPPVSTCEKCGGKPCFWISSEHKSILIYFDNFHFGDSKSQFTLPFNSIICPMIFLGPVLPHSLIWQGAQMLERMEDLKAQIAKKKAELKAEKLFLVRLGPAMLSTRVYRSICMIGTYWNSTYIGFYMFDSLGIGMDRAILLYLYKQSGWIAKRRIRSWAMQVCQVVQWHFHQFHPQRPSKVGVKKLTIQKLYSNSSMIP